MKIKDFVIDIGNGITLLSLVLLIGAIIPGLIIYLGQIFYLNIIFLFMYIVVMRSKFGGWNLLIPIISWIIAIYAFYFPIPSNPWYGALVIAAASFFWNGTSGDDKND